MARAYLPVVAPCSRAVTNAGLPGGAQTLGSHHHHPSPMDAVISANPLRGTERYDYPDRVSHTVVQEIDRKQCAYGPFRNVVVWVMRRASTWHVRAIQ